MGTDENGNLRKAPEKRDDAISFDAERAEFFEALGHPTRTKMLQVLAQGQRSFSELKKQLGIESSGNLSFHLGKLDGLVKTNSDGNYTLTDNGKEAVLVIETSLRTENCKEEKQNRRHKLEVTPIAISIVWAVMMLVISFYLGGITTLGTEVLEVLIFGFIASLLIVTSIGQNRGLRTKF